VLMFSFMILIHLDMVRAAVIGIIVTAAAMTSFLYLWLTAPLEPEHHH
jgi:hypothetical protein